MESRGNNCASGGNNSFGSTLHWGPAWNQDPFELTHADYTHTESLADAMHTYGLVWTEDRIFTYIDDESNVVLDVDTSSQDFWTKGGFTGFNAWEGAGKNAPFDQEFYLILNVAVGGTSNYFPDGQCGKTWSNKSTQAAYDFWNTKDAWYPSWNYPATNQAAMKIDYVRVWQDDGTVAFTQ